MMKYSELTLALDVDAFCLGCSDYKSVYYCADADCGATFCLYCDDGCSVCGLDIDFSA